MYIGRGTLFGATNFGITTIVIKTLLWEKTHVEEVMSSNPKTRDFLFLNYFVEKLDCLGEKSFCD